MYLTIREIYGHFDWHYKKTGTFYVSNENEIEGLQNEIE